MKKFFTILVFFAILAMSNAFALPNFWFSGVAFNTSGQVLPGTPVEVLINLTDGANTFSEQFVSPSTILTDAFGIFSVQVGTGSNLGGSLAAILMKSNTQLTVQVRTVGGSWVTVNGSPLTQSILDATSAAKAFSFPNSTGNNGQVLTSEGNGLASWKDPVVQVDQIICDISVAPNTYAVVGNLMFRYNSNQNGGSIEAKTINNSEFMMVYATKSNSTWWPNTSTTSTVLRNAMASFNSSNWSPLILLADQQGQFNIPVPLSYYETFEGIMTPTYFINPDPKYSYKFFVTIDGYNAVVIRVEYFKK